jgi:hypothetical protein
LGNLVKRRSHMSADMGLKVGRQPGFRVGAPAMSSNSAPDAPITCSVHALDRIRQFRAAGFLFHFVVHASSPIRTVARVPAEASCHRNNPRELKWSNAGEPSRLNERL